MVTLSVVDLRLLDKDGGRYQLVKIIEKALTNIGAFYVVGITGYDEFKFSDSVSRFLDLTEKEVLALGSLEKGPAADHLAPPQNGPTKEGYETQPISFSTPNRVTGLQHNSESEHAIQQHYAILRETMKLLTSLIADGANLSYGAVEVMLTAAEQPSLSLRRNLSIDGETGQNSEINANEYGAYDNPAFLSVCATKDSVRVTPLDGAKSAFDTKPPEGGVLVYSGPALAELTKGKYCAAQCVSSKPSSFGCCAVISGRLTADAAFFQIQNGKVLPTDRLPLSESAVTMSSVFEKSLSDYLLPLKQDVEAGFLEKRSGDPCEEENETFLKLLSQVIFPFLMAGMGVVGAGLVLNIVKDWKVFREVKTLFIMVPPLLGLKGNLEMTLASRLSTQANLGHMEDKREILTLVQTNLALTQVQAIVVGLLASIVAILMDLTSGDTVELSHGIFMGASAIATASTASFILGIIMVAVIVLSSKYKVNPDNIATPIAASLGDLLTLGLLAGFSTLFYMTLDKYDWLLPAVIGIFISVVPLFIWISLGHKQTEQVIKTGWGPILGSMVISSAGGFILDHFVNQFSAFAVFQPVISGVGGNLVAVQASRISTWLHQNGIPGTVPEKAGPVCVSPGSVFCQSGPHTASARVLLLLVVPGQLIFATAIKVLNSGAKLEVDIGFMFLYAFVAFVQVLILLYIANGLVLFLWRRKVDPDNAAIPFLTAFGDLLGSSFLAAAFVLYYFVQDQGAVERLTELSTDYNGLNNTVSYVFTDTAVL